MEFMILHELG